MTETSRSQVTITLGRSGQVVKRAGAVLDSEFCDSVPAVGSKRPVRDRLGRSVDAVPLDNKRQRGIDGRLSLKASNGVDDIRLSKDDLRFKIMKQSQSNGPHKNVDLRDMLSRQARPLSTNRGISQSFPESRNSRQRVPGLTPEPREPMDDQWRMPDERRPMPEPMGERRNMPDPREGKQRMPELRDGRRFMPCPVEVGQHIFKLNDDRQRIPDPMNGSMPGRVTYMRTSEAPSNMDLLRNSYSPWTLDHIRRRSPDRVLDNSRSLIIPPPPPRTEEPQKKPIMREYDNSRAVTHASQDVREISRPMTTTSVLAKPVLSTGPTKPVGPLVAPQLLPGGVVQQSQYPVERLTVEGFLHSLGLDKYLISFKVEEVDMAALSQMGDHDLKELGIPMGPRKKILLALLARSRRQP